MSKGKYKRTLKWRAGDLFAVPLVDGSFGFAQAIAPVESWAIDFALLSSRSTELKWPKQSISESDAIGVLATWRTVVTGGHWAKVGSAAPCLSVDSCPNQLLIAAGENGVTHADWGLLQKFLSAFHGLFPWNLYPAFDFDSYLLPNRARPASAKVLSALELHNYKENESRKIAA